jgi:hypothetical protein
MVKRFKGAKSNDTILPNFNNQNNLKFENTYQLTEIDIGNTQKLPEKELASAKNRLELLAPISRSTQAQYRSKTSSSFAIQKSSILIGYKIVVSFCNKMFRRINLNSTIEITF